MLSFRLFCLSIVILDIKRRPEWGATRVVWCAMETARQIAVAGLVMTGCYSKPKPKEVSEETKLTRAKNRIEEYGNELAVLQQQRFDLRREAGNAARRFRDTNDPASREEMNRKLAQDGEKLREITAVTTHRRELQMELEKTRLGYIRQTDTDIMFDLQGIQAHKTISETEAEEARIKFLISTSKVDDKELENLRIQREELERQQQAKTQTFDMESYVAQEAAAIFSMLSQEKDKLKEEEEKVNAAIKAAQAAKPAPATATSNKNYSLPQQAKLVSKKQANGVVSA